MIPKEINEKRKYIVGQYTYGVPNIPFSGNLEIGNFCSIAKDVTILLNADHHTEWISTYPFSHFFKECKYLGNAARKGKKTTIGNDVWLCMNSIILPGITIGDGAVIGAGSVVSSDVEPYSIFVGNPGKTIKKRFDDLTIQKLLEIKWWDWDIKKIIENASLLCSENIEEFINKYYNSSRKKAPCFSTGVIDIEKII